MNSWYSNPTILIVAGVGIFAAVILMRGSKGSTKETDVQPIPTAGGNYQYLDGSGYQHIIATDPYGNPVGYSSIPPTTQMPEVGQMSSYVGSMSGQYLVNPWGSSTPYYAMGPNG